MVDPLDTAWILRNHVIPVLGVGDLHALEAASPVLCKTARKERFAKNSMQLVVVPRKVTCTIYARNYNRMKVGLWGLHYSA